MVEAERQKSTAFFFLFFCFYFGGAGERRDTMWFVISLSFFKKEKIFNIKRVGVDNFKSPVIANN